jgi:broad specificity phosphatase PhoE
VKLYLARHGQTNYNEARLCNADPSVDVYLTKTGIKQAAKLANDLKDATIQHIYISELRRTEQTADIINQYHQAPVTVDARLNDNRSGFEGKLVSDYYAALDAAPNKWEARLNDGESVADVKTRVNSFMQDLKTQDYKTVLIVTSMIIIQTVYGIINNLSYEDLRKIEVARGSCTKLELTSA